MICCEGTTVSTPESLALRFSLQTQRLRPRTKTKQCPRVGTGAEAVVGLRVKSGFAIAVLVAGPVRSPQVLDCRVIDLSDPAIPESRQPHHAGLRMREEDQSKLARLLKIVERVTNTSVTKLLKDYRRTGCRLCGAALAVGSVIEPASIANPHIRAHALEGQLFRTVLKEALTAAGLPCPVLVERDAYAKASSVLGKTEADLKRAVTSLGHSMSGSWRAQEKLAALAAWTALP
jgi:hypothetical protein